jgi:hypothetical protein
VLAAVTHHEPAALLDPIFGELFYELYVPPVDRRKMTRVVVTCSEKMGRMFFNMVESIRQLILVPFSTGYLARFTTNTNRRICEKTFGSHSHKNDLGLQIADRKLISSNLQSYLCNPQFTKY